MSNTAADAAKLVSFIQGLAEFHIPEQNSETYQHMGATLTDAALQAGVNYKNVVKPRVQALIRDYPEAHTTTGFSQVLQEKEPRNVLNWQGERKIKTLLQLTHLMQSEGVETEAQLAKWLVQHDRKDVLCAITGVGPKTYDYLWLLCGLEAVAVDVHLFNFATQAGVSGSYQQVRDAMSEAAKLLNYSSAQLDHAIWLHQSKR